MASKTDGDDGGGVYRPFAEYAWTKLQQSGLLDSGERNLVPEDLMSNASPAKGMPEGCTVQVAVKGSWGEKEGTIRYGRYALLETLDQDNQCVDQGIHVLNLVVFPSLANMPVLGMDLVTLPGSKHLVAMDFQPTSSLSGQLSLPTQVEERLKELHQKHTASGALPWGGDIPEPAQRYFSPYAIWTRLKGPLDVIEDNVFPAFCDYVDLYFEYASSVCASDGDATEENEGQASYLNYRRTNDPARPMLQRLYGEEWTERLIETVLFKDI
jgi:phycoerythrobilin:ferredoxin oxidoreductase